MQRDALFRDPTTTSKVRLDHRNVLHERRPHLVIHRLVLAVAVAVPRASAEELPRVSVIANVMAAREEATSPYWLRYKVVERRAGHIYWAFTFNGSVYRDRTTLIRRLKKFAHHPKRGGVFDQDAHTVMDSIAVLAKGTAPFQLWRPEASQDSVWHGASGSRQLPTIDGYWTPARFGLHLAGKAYSEYVRGPSSRVVGRVRLGQFDCIEVYTDLRDGSGMPPAPLVLWLSEAHGYYPIQIALYIDVRVGNRYVEGKVLRVERETYKPKMLMITEKLIAVGPGWLTSRGRKPSLLRESHGEMTLEVDEPTLRYGDAIDKKCYSLADVNRAVVVGAFGGHYVIGSGPHDVSPDRLRELAKTVRGESLGLYRAPIDKRTNPWVLVSIAVCSGLAGYGVWAWRRRSRGSRDDPATRGAGL